MAVPVAMTDVSQSVPSSTRTTTIEGDDTAAAESERAVPTASTTKPLSAITAIAAAVAADIPSVRPGRNSTVTVTTSVPEKAVKTKGAAHGFAKINAKSPSAVDCNLPIS
jgi:hypothetical protein